MRITKKDELIFECVLVSNANTDRNLHIPCVRNEYALVQFKRFRSTAIYDMSVESEVLFCE